MADKLLVMERVVRRWGPREVLRGVNLTVDRGDFLLITGPNGGGKTTLLRIMLRLLRPSEGSLLYFDTAGHITRHVPTGYLPQKSTVDSRFPVTAQRVAEMGLLDHPAGARRVAALHALERVGLADRADSSLGALSGGQMQRVLLARAVAAAPELLVLDEPLSYLDVEAAALAARVIGEESRRGATVVVVSHDLGPFRHLATRTLYVDGSLRQTP